MEIICISPLSQVTPVVKTLPVAYFTFKSEIWNQEPGPGVQSVVGDKVGVPVGEEVGANVFFGLPRGHKSIGGVMILSLPLQSPLHPLKALFPMEVLAGI